MRIRLASSAFKEGSMIPRVYTCGGDNISPPLTWDKLPVGAESVALIVDDPDATIGPWVHWVLYDLPPDANQIEENVPTEALLPNGAKQGSNSVHRFGYFGPCPPRGAHRYYFRLYALDTRLDMEPGASRSDLIRAMHGHILGDGKLMGRYCQS